MVKCIPLGNTGIPATTFSLLVCALWWMAPVRAQQKSGNTADLDLHWQELANSNAGPAYNSIKLLTTSPERTAALLDKHLDVAPRPTVDRKKIRMFIARLDNESFRQRETASLALAKLGDAARIDLASALSRKPSLEAKRRIEQLLQRIRPTTLPSRELRVWRAIEVLERIGSPNAKRVLARLANGRGSSLLTKEAKRSLDRLHAQKKPAPLADS